jgi:hypothetical protein
MSNGEFRVLGRYNAFDAALLAVVAVAIAGFMLARAGHAGVNKVIHGTQKVDILIFFAGVKTRDLDLFKVGDPSALTIRNQPVYPPLTITAVKHSPKQIAFLAPDGKSAISLPDPTIPLANDFEVTVTNNADVTDDGYVVCQQKLKIGNMVELEGFNYRIQGVVAGISPSKK